VFLRMIVSRQVYPKDCRKSSFCRLFLSQETFMICLRRFHVSFTDRETKIGYPGGGPIGTEEYMVAGPEQVRILVVSASPYTRYVVSGELNGQPDFFVVGTARSPEEIDGRRAMLRPDLAVVELSSRNDLSDLQPILMRHTLPVVGLCARDRDGADLALAALEAGVIDVVARSNGVLDSADFGADLLHKVRGTVRSRSNTHPFQWSQLHTRNKTSRRRFLPGDYLVIVSASVGGLGPLVQLLSGLPADLRASVLAYVPLPASYLGRFMRRIGPGTSFFLRQARDASPIERGVAYLAAQRQRICIEPRGFLRLEWEAYRGSEPPIVDTTLASFATGYGPAVLAVILSGTGRDGVQGALDVRGAGGWVMVQDVDNCIAAETPQAVIEAGAANAVVAPDQMTDEILHRIGQTSSS
jgi:two-component system chemotaxis response regulator CheB